MLTFALGAVYGAGVLVAGTLAVVLHLGFPQRTTAREALTTVACVLGWPLVLAYGIIRW